MDNFFKKNKELVIYYRDNLSHSDELYFSRSKKLLIDQTEIDLFHSDYDFSTLHDYTFSKIIAYKNLTKWIDNEILLLESSNLMEPPNNYHKYQNINWTGHKMSLIELVYSLHNSKVINNGNIDIKTLVNHFEKMFNITLDDYSRIFIDIKKQKN